jgi:hypothetical protein
MKWWKRLILSITSLVWGYISMDYLYFAMGNLTGTRMHQQAGGASQTFLWQLAGFGMFLLWLLILAAYTTLIRFLSPKIDLVEVDEKEKNPKVRRKIFDIIFQYGIIIIGVLVRWAYLCLVYLPNR